MVSVEFVDNLSSRGPRAVQEFQVKHPRFGDLKKIIKKTLIFEAQYLTKDKRQLIFDIDFPKAN